MSMVGPPETRPADGLAIDFVVESDRAQLGEIVQRVRDGRLRTNIGAVATLDDAVAALNPTERPRGRRSSAFARERRGCASSYSARRPAPDRPAAPRHRTYRPHHQPLRGRSDGVDGVATDKPTLAELIPGYNAAEGREIGEMDGLFARDVWDTWSEVSRPYPAAGIIAGIGRAGPVGL